jgi:hypothetical protein
MKSSRSVPSIPSSLACTLSAIAASLLLAAPAAAQRRSPVPPGGSNRIRQSSLVGGLVTQDMATGGHTPASLVQALVGTGVTVTNIQFSGAPVAAGTFTGGTGIIGFEQGLVLGSGDIASVVGPQNLLPDTSTDNLLPGDPDLDLLVSGATQDAVVLEFDFQCPTTNQFVFQYVFSSEEYDEWVNSPFNDVFAFFLNGQNIALIPGTTTPVAINNVNCNNPYLPPTGQNCALYKTNACDSLAFGYPCTNIGTEMDGMTILFSATATLHAGPNHMKLTIADRGDGILDSNVFIRGQSFTCGGVVPVFDPPSPCGKTLEAGFGVPFHFEVEALATNGLPGQTVTLSVAGDTVPLAGGIFTPPLPTAPADEVGTEFEWTPSAADAGTWHLQFTVTDQVGASSTCDVAIHVGASPGVDACLPGAGSVMACPCNNPSGNFHSGCDNSNGTGGARLFSAGSPSISADTLVFSTRDQRPLALSVLVQGDALLANGVTYGQGVRCVAGGLKRLYVKVPDSDSITAPQGADPSVVSRSLDRGDPILPGQSRYYAVYYRDPIVLGTCPGTATFNTTQTQQIVWTP